MDIVKKLEGLYRGTIQRNSNIDVYRDAYIRIRRLERDVGLAEMALDQKTELLESCEKALADRDNKIENAREFVSHIPLHTEDPHALHFAQMAENWLSGDNSDLKPEQN